jgi:hypothetical protein
MVGELTKMENLRIAWEKWPVKKEAKEEEKLPWEVDEDSAYHMQPIMNLHEVGSEKPIYTEDDFNFWILHTNFNITFVDWKNIAEFEGIETLDGISKYRVRIGIGKLFDHNKVRKSLNNLLLRGRNGSEENSLLS